MSKLGKRAIPILIIAIFAFSLLPAFPVFAAITIDTVDPGNGDKGDTIEVTGSGVTAGMDVNLYWDAVKAWDGEKGLLNSTEAGADGSYEIWFDVPEALNGNHYIWVKDTDTGSTEMWGVAFIVDAKISLDPSSGLEGDDVTINGYGFSDEVDIVVLTFNGVDIIPASNPETDDIGSWSATFEVPDMGGVYGDYTVYAEDDEGIWATVDYTIGASIDLDVDEGPVGTVVEVSGRGFLGDEVTTVTYNGIVCKILDEDDKEIDDGEFTLEIAIPSVADEDEYDVEVTDDFATVADDSFEVDGLASIDLEPSYGVQGSTISIHGYNFTQIAEEEVTLFFGATEVDDFETDGNGEFEGTFVVPAIASGTYDVFARQADYNIVNDDEEFKVGLMLVILSKGSGATGASVTLTGTGFTALGEWNATLGDETIFEEMTVGGDGTISDSFYVPTINVGTYTIMVLDVDTDIEVTTEFEVTAKTMAEIDPLVAPNDYNMTLTGSYFAADEGADIDFVLYNSTDEWDMVVKINDDAATLDEDGAFEAWWEVPDDETVSIGCYTINVTDKHDLFTQISFCVVSKTVDIEPRKTTFAIGDTVSFDIVSSFSQPDSYIKIWNPDADLYWVTDALNEWVKVGVTQVAPYYSQVSGGNPMILIPDAPLGTWTWTWYDDDDELDTGSFTVVEAADAMLSEQMEALSEEFSTLSDDFSDLSGEFSGLSDDLADTTAAVEANVDALEDVVDSVASIANTSNEAKTAADEAKTAADAAKTAADEAKTATSGLTTLVYGAIGASLVAALAAIVSLMQISRRIAG